MKTRQVRSLNTGQCSIGAELSIVEESTERILRGREEGLTPHEVRHLVSFFRKRLAPRQAGRKRSPILDAAFADWQAGLRGNALYSKHIPRYDKMGRWRRKAEQQRLMNSIYSRHRRRALLSEMAID